MNTIDSYKPVFYRVSIDASTLNNSAPADGFIDPTTVERYRRVDIHTGTQSAPTVADGDTIKISGVSITFTTAGGLDLTGIVDTINEMTTFHHAIASDNGGNLELTNEALYEGYGLTMFEVTPGVLAKLGFVNPTVATQPRPEVTDRAASLAKERGNVRWEILCKLLNYNASTYFMGAVVKDGDIDTDPTTIEFTVGFHSLGHVYTNDELNNNAIIEGIPAVKRLVARALTFGATLVRDFIDPTPTTEGFEIGSKIEKVVVGALADNLGDAEDATTVTAIVDVH